MTGAADTAVRLASAMHIDDGVRRDVRDAVGTNRAEVVGERELSRDPAVWECRLRASHLTLVAIRDAVRVNLPAGIDVCAMALPDSPRRRLVVLDVDSTLIEQEVIELIAEHAGTRTEVAAVTAAAMRGELDFGASLRSRVATLAGLPVTVLAQVGAAVRLTPGARTLVTVLQAHGHSVGVVSGGFQEILDPLAQQLRLNHARANRLGVVAGRLSGSVDGEVVDRAGKAASVRRWRDCDGVLPADVVAIGDGANDLDMIAEAGLGVAFCATPALREAADTTVSFPRLDVVLHYLGLTDDDVEAALVGTGIRRGQ